MQGSNESQTFDQPNWTPALKLHWLETINRADKDDNGNNDNFDSSGDIDDDEKLSL